MAAGDPHAHQQRHHRADRAGDARGVGLQFRRAWRSGGPARPMRGLRSGRRAARAAWRSSRTTSASARSTGSACGRAGVDRVEPRAQPRAGAVAAVRRRSTASSAIAAEGVERAWPARAPRRGSSSEAAVKEFETRRAGARGRRRDRPGPRASGEGGCIGHHRVEDAGRGQHAGHAGAGMGARADQIEVADVLAAVVRAEPGALRAAPARGRRRRPGTTASRSWKSCGVQQRARSRSGSRDRAAASRSRLAHSACR